MIPTFYVTQTAPLVYRHFRSRVQCGWALIPVNSNNREDDWTDELEPVFVQFCQPTGPTIVIPDTVKEVFMEIFNHEIVD